MAIKLGVVGAGRMGRVHVENIQNLIPDACVWAVADSYMNDEISAWAKSLGVKKIYKTHEEMLMDPEVQAVVIATPVKTHLSISLDALKSGRHVFCEKPLDIQLDHIRKIIEQAETTGLVYQVGFNRRFDPDYMEAKRRIGNAGKVYMVKLTSKDMLPPSYLYVRESGGQIIDSAIHEIDLIRYLTEDEVDEVYAAGQALIDPKIAEYHDTDVCVLMLKMAGGGYALIDIARQSPAGADRRIEIFTEKEIIRVENKPSGLISALTHEGTRQLPPADGMSRFAESWRREMAAFVESIRDGKKVQAGPVDGLRSMEIAMAANQSLLQNKPVKIIRSQ